MEDEVYSCGICNAKNLTPNKENEIDHACLNGLSIFIDTNFVLRPQMIDPESGHLISIRNEECKEIKEYHEPNEQYSSCIKQKNSIVERNSGKKRPKLKTEIEIWTGEHITYLIQLVRDNEIIWNYYISLKERSKLQVAIAWDVIVEELKSMFPEVSSNFNPIVVQAKWKSLVDYFWRKVASRPKTPGSAAGVLETWPYFKNMTFLQDMQNQKTVNNFSDEENKENKINEKIRRKKNKNDGIEQIASALTELAKAQTQSITPPPPSILSQNIAPSKLTLKEKKIQDFLQLMQSLMQDIPDTDLDNVFFSIHEIIHKTKK